MNVHNLRALDYFNPFATRFHTARDFASLGTLDKVKTVAAAILGSLFFGIGALAAFRYMTEKYRYKPTPVGQLTAQQIACLHRLFKWDCKEAGKKLNDAQFQAAWKIATKEIPDFFTHPPLSLLSQIISGSAPSPLIMTQTIPVPPEQSFVYQQCDLLKTEDSFEAKLLEGLDSFVKDYERAGFEVQCGDNPPFILSKNTNLLSAFFKYVKEAYLDYLRKENPTLEEPALSDFHAKLSEIGYSFETKRSHQFGKIAQKLYQKLDKVSPAGLDFVQLSSKDLEGFPAGSKEIIEKRIRMKLAEMMILMNQASFVSTYQILSSMLFEGCDLLPRQTETRFQFQWSQDFNSLLIIGEWSITKNNEKEELFKIKSELAIPSLSERNAPQPLLTLLLL